MRIGLIAGSGQFPIIFCQRAREHGFGVYAVAYLNEADPRLAAHVEAIVVASPGQGESADSVF